MRDSISLDSAAAQLESDRASDHRKARNRGASMNLARWRRNIRNK
jgi:hypothetical protein